MPEMLFYEVLCALGRLLAVLGLLEPTVAIFEEVPLGFFYYPAGVVGLTMPPLSI